MSCNSASEQDGVTCILQCTTIWLSILCQNWILLVLPYHCLY